MRNWQNRMAAMFRRRSGRLQYLGSVDESAAGWAGARAGRWGAELVWEWESVTRDGIWDGRSEEFWILTDSAFTVSVLSVSESFIYEAGHGTASPPQLPCLRPLLFTQTLLSTRPPTTLFSSSLPLSSSPAPSYVCLFFFLPCRSHLLTLLQNILSMLSQRLSTLQWAVLPPPPPLPAAAALNTPSSPRSSRTWSSVQRSPSRPSSLLLSTSTELNLISISLSKNGPWNESSSVPSS